MANLIEILIESRNRAEAGVAAARRDLAGLEQPLRGVGSAAQGSTGAVTRLSRDTQTLGQSFDATEKQATQLVAQIKRVQDQQRTVATPASGAGGELTGPLGSIAGIAAGFSVGALATQGFTAAVHAAGEAIQGVIARTRTLADQYNRFAQITQRTGLPTAEVAAYADELGDLGLPLELITNSFRFLSDKLKENDPALRALVGTTGDAREAFMRLADIIAATEDPTLRSAIATNALGRSSEQLVPFLSRGRDGLAALVETSKGFGVAIDELGQQDLAQLKAAIEQTNDVIDGMGNSFAVLTAGPLATFESAIGRVAADLSVSFLEARVRGLELVQVVRALSAAVDIDPKGFQQLAASFVLAIPGARELVAAVGFLKSTSAKAGAGEDEATARARRELDLARTAEITLQGTDRIRDALAAVKREIGDIATQPMLDEAALANAEQRLKILEGALKQGSSTAGDYRAQIAAFIAELNKTPKGTTQDLLPFGPELSAQVKQIIDLFGFSTGAAIDFSNAIDQAANEEQRNKLAQLGVQLGALPDSFAPLSAKAKEIVDLFGVAADAAVTFANAIEQSANEERLARLREVLIQLHQIPGPLTEAQANFKAPGAEQFSALRDAGVKVSGAVEAAFARAFQNITSDAQTLRGAVVSIFQSMEQAIIQILAQLAAQFLLSFIPFLNIANPFVHAAGAASAGAVGGARPAAGGAAAQEPGGARSVAGSASAQQTTNIHITALDSRSFSDSVRSPYGAVNQSQVREFELAALQGRA